MAKIEEGLDYVLFLESGKFLMVSKTIQEQFFHIVDSLAKESNDYLCEYKKIDGEVVATFLIRREDVVCVAHKRHFSQAI